MHTFGTDRKGVAPKCSTDVIVTDAQEKELGMLGFIPLCHCQDTELSAFYGNQSVQEPHRVRQGVGDDQRPAVGDAPIHPVRLALRPLPQGDGPRPDRLASPRPATCSIISRTGCATTPLPTTRPSNQYPLREGRVEVEELPDKPGSYGCRIFLRPHYQLDQLTSVLRLESTLAPAKT